MIFHPHLGGGYQQWLLLPKDPQNHGRISYYSSWTYIELRLEIKKWDLIFTFIPILLAICNSLIIPQKTLRIFHMCEVYQTYMFRARLYNLSLYCTTNIPETENTKISENARISEVWTVHLTEITKQAINTE